jgi:hypothetical protein
MNASKSSWYNFRFFSLLAILIMGISLIAVSCYPDGGLNSISDFDVVATVFDNEVDFSKNKTYSMPPYVVHIISADSVDTVQTSLDQAILSRIVSNMSNYGYTKEVLDTTNWPNNATEVILLPATTTTTWRGYSYYPGWGGWWGGWWGYPGYGGGYPGYTVPYEYQTGSVLVEMVDPRKVNQAEKKVGIIWSGALNGLLGSSNPTPRVTQGIDQMFAQSEYLKTN